MKRFAAGMLAAAMLLAGRAAWGYGAQSANIPMSSPEPHIPYGERVAANDFYDAYYDGAYGVFSDGYWGTDGHFWYLSAPSSTIWAPDEGGHFRRTPADGFALVRGTGVHREN